MLKTIAIVTLVVRQLASVERAYQEHLDYAAVHRGREPRSSRAPGTPADGRPALRGARA